MAGHCSNCGREGHNKLKCYAKTHVDGGPVKTSSTRSAATGKGAYTVRLPQRITASGKGRYGLKSNRTKVSGKGAYIGNFGGALGSALGTLVAPGIGTDVGGALGTLGSALIDKITGKGAYNISKNSILEPGYAQPSFGEESIRVRHTEFVENVDATTTFTNRTYPLNPGIASVFPWLSAIARNYEQYRVNGMIIQYKSTTSDAIASATALGFGQVIMATNYDASAAGFESQEQMLNYMFSNSGKPSIDILHAIECEPTDTPYKLHYVRSGAIPTNADAKLYDHGIFQLATTGMQAAYSGMGQLFISYDISFFKPVQNNTLGFSVLQDQYQLTGALNTSSTLGSTSTKLSGSNIGTSIVQDGSGNWSILQFPEDVQDGVYLISYDVEGASTAVASPTFVLQNCEILNAWDLNTQPGVDNGGTTATVVMHHMIVRLTGQSTAGELATIKFEFTAIPTSPTSGNLLVVQLNGEIYEGFTALSLGKASVKELTDGTEDEFTEEERAVIKAMREKRNKALEPPKDAKASKTATK